MQSNLGTGRVATTGERPTQSSKRTCEVAPMWTASNAYLMLYLRRQWKSGSESQRDRLLPVCRRRRLACPSPGKSQRACAEARALTANYSLLRVRVRVCEWVSERLSSDLYTWRQVRAPARTDADSCRDERRHFIANSHRPTRHEATRRSSCVVSRRAVSTGYYVRPTAHWAGNVTLIASVRRSAVRLSVSVCFHSYHRVAHCKSDQPILYRYPDFGGRNSETPKLINKKIGVSAAYVGDNSPHAKTQNDRPIMAFTHMHEISPSRGFQFFFPFFFCDLKFCSRPQRKPQTRFYAVFFV